MFPLHTLTFGCWFVVITSILILADTPHVRKISTCSRFFFLSKFSVSFSLSHVTSTWIDKHFRRFFKNIRIQKKKNYKVQYIMKWNYFSQVDSWRFVLNSYPKIIQKYLSPINMNNSIPTENSNDFPFVHFHFTLAH